MNDQQPGWHPDPGGTHQHRYWDGSRWTDDVADAGVTSTDPLSSAPGDPTRAMPTPATGAFAAGAAAGAPSDPGPGPTGPLPAEAGAKRGVVIGIVAVLAVALLVGGFLVFGGDDGDGDGDLASEVREDRTTTTAPDDDIDFDDLDLDDLDDLDDFDFGDLDAFGLGGLGAGDFDPTDPIGSTARIYEDLLGLSAAQSRCLAEAMFDLFAEDEDQLSADAMGGVFGAFETCNISMSDLGGFDPGG